MGEDAVASNVIQVGLDISDIDVKSLLERNPADNRESSLEGAQTQNEMDAVMFEYAPRVFKEIRLLNGVTHELLSE